MLPMTPAFRAGAGPISVSLLAGLIGGERKVQRRRATEGGQSGLMRAICAQQVDEQRCRFSRFLDLRLVAPEPELAHTAVI